MIKMKSFAIFLLAFCYIALPTQVKGENMIVENGKTVGLNYTLTVEGEVVDSSEGKEPLKYVHGEGNIIPGLAQELEGMRVGEQKLVEVAPSEAYGEVNPEAYRDIPKEQLPENMEPQEGLMIQMQTPAGQAIPVTISEVKDDMITIDMNHPLAGKTLKFDVEIISVD